MSHSNARTPGRGSGPKAAGPPDPADGLGGPDGDLAAWVAARAGDFEGLAERRDSDAPMVGRALAIVRAFIARKGLILYGGQAIDYALRLRGSRIYGDDQIPDFDFFSENHVADAYELAQQLADEGFPNVTAIRAIHPQTMRVRVDFVTVADISFAPPAVFATLPTLDYAVGGARMKIVHPDYQRTDMHLAFCFPFSGAPREDLFHRYAKDLKRFRLFQEYYPIEGPKLAASAKKSVKDDAKLSAAVFDPARAAVHGVAGFALLRRALEAAAGAKPQLKTKADRDAFAAAVAEAKRVLRRAPKPQVNFVEVAGTTASAPGQVSVAVAGAPAILATPWPDEVVAGVAAGAGKKAKVRWRAPYMDSRPRTAEVAVGKAAAALVYSTEGRRLVVVEYHARELKVPLQLVSPQYLLLYFLLESMLADGPARAEMRWYYRSVLDVLAAGGALTAVLGRQLPPATFGEFVEAGPFGLPMRPLGDVDESVAQLTFLANDAAALGEPADSPARAKAPPEKDLPARTHSPRKGETPPAPKVGGPLFEMDGRHLE